MKLIWCWRPAVKSDFPGKRRIPCDRVYLLRQEWLSIHHYGTCYSQHFLGPPAEEGPRLHMQFQRGHKDAMGVCAFQLFCCPTRTPRKASRTVTEPQGALQGLTFSNNPWPTQLCLQAPCDKFPGWSRYFRRRPPLSQAAGMAASILPGVLTQRAVNTHSLSNMPW